MTRTRAVVLGVLVLGLGLWAWNHRAKGPTKTAAEESPLYTGKEAKQQILLCFPALDKPGFSQEKDEIYLTASKGAQLKQALKLLFQGPRLTATATGAFPSDFKYRDVFITSQGMAVVDLDPDSVKTLPGGTSSEYASLYCLVRTILDNFKDVKQVQILVGGQYQESLTGHMDISGPLTLSDF